MFTYPIGLLNNKSGVLPPPAVISDGNSVAWYIADDLSTITKDVSDFVSVWADKLGSGNDLLESTNKPKWFLDDGILFDGVNDVMKTGAFTFNQPEQIYIVFKQVTWTSNLYIFDGNTLLKGALRQTAGTNQIVAYAGSNSGGQTLALDTYAIVRILFNGASSEIILNEDTPVTGNFGANNMGGFTLGALGNGTQGYTNIQVKEIILRKIADSSGDETDIYDYLKSKYSL